MRLCLWRYAMVYHTSKFYYEKAKKQLPLLKIREIIEVQIKMKFLFSKTLLHGVSYIGLFYFIYVAIQKFSYISEAFILRH